MEVIQMILLDANTSLDIMDAMINNEVISHTEAKKLMTKQVKPAHRELLLNTLTHTEKEFSFSSFDNDSDLFGKKRTKRIVGKMYNKHDVLIAIEEYKANNNLKEQFNNIIKQDELNKQYEIELMNQANKEQELKQQIELRATEIMEQHNKEVTMNINTDSNDIESMLNIFDQLVNNTMSEEAAYQQAKQEILG
jgi:hypothetical protein